MLLIFTLISFLISTVLCVCPTGTEAGGASGLCYKPFPIRSTWYQGESTCVQNGGHLASERDVFTAAFLVGLADFPFNHTDFWLGGTTNFLGGMWSWPDFANLTYINWAGGQPNNSLGYCLMQRAGDGKWISVDCTQQKPFICEYPQVQQQTCTCPTALPCASTQPTTLSSQNPCPNNNWVYSNNDDFSKCYYFNTSAINWNDSYVACQNLYNGATLVTIHSSAENDFITNVFRNKYPVPTASDSDYYWIWIGLRSIDPVNMIYQWVDNTTLDYTNWGDNNPDGRTCVHFDPTFQGDGVYGQWFDDSCDITDLGFTTNLGFVCELQL